MLGLWCGQGRYESSDQRRYKCERNGCRDRPRVECCLMQLWDAVGGESEEGLQQQGCKGESCHACDYGEIEAFCHCETREPASSGTERGTYCKLTPASGRTGEQQIRDVGAGDQQQCTYCGEEKPGCLAHVAELPFAQRPDPQSNLRTERRRHTV